MPRQLAVLPRGPSAHHRPGASASCGGALLALLSGVLLCLQAAAQRVPGVSWAVAADLIHQQGSGRQLLRLSSGRDDLEPLAVESILDPADEKGGGVHANLIGSGSSFAAALHSVRIRLAYSSADEELLLPYM